MEVLTHDQKLLTKYLKSTGMSAARGMYIVGILWDEEATVEMLEYIAKTKETNQETLFMVACEISKKYENKTSDNCNNCPTKD